MSERDAFGPSLKAERDRRGITLQTIADSTKVSVSLLAALERNDLSRWPKGIFRRAFVREYATALGLLPDPIVAEFVRLFPDGSCPEATAVPSTELRLTLEHEPSATWSSIRLRALLSGLELCGVVSVSSLLAWLMETPFLSTSAVLALAYYSIAGTFLERSPRPRLLLPAGPARWLDGAVRVLKRPANAWPRPSVSVADSGHDDRIESQGTATPEWRTASN